MMVVSLGEGGKREEGGTGGAGGRKKLLVVRRWWEKEGRLVKLGLLFNLYIIIIII